MNDLDRLFKRATRNTIHNEGRPGILGNAAGTIYFTDESGQTRGNVVWIRYVDSDGPLAEATVRNPNGLPAVVGLPIRVVTRRGVLVAEMDRYSERMADFVNQNGWVPQSQHAHTHYLEGTDPLRIEGLAFSPGAVKPSSPAAMTVYVNPVWYMFDGTEYVFEGGTSASLSSYVPGTDDGTQHFIIVCLDRASNAVALVDGADYGGFWGAVLTLSDISAISINADYYPLAVVEFYYGQTTIVASDITFDRRRWGDSHGETPGNQSILFSQTADKTVANTDSQTTLLTTGTGSLTIPAGQLAAGSVVRLAAAGHVSTTSTPTMDFEVTLGGTSLGSTGATALGDTISNVGWRLYLDVVCRTIGASGTVVTSGWVRLGTQLIGIVKTSTTTVDTTGTLVVDFLGTWGTADASNTITCQTAVVERLNVIGLS